MAKLSDIEKNNIIEKFKTGAYTKTNLALEYNVDESSIRKIINGNFKGSQKQNGYIYIITSKEFIEKDIYKIGLSFNADTRLKQLQTGNPFKLFIHKSFYVNDLYNIEKTIHSFLYDDRLEGEWFRIPDCVLKRIETYLTKYEVFDGKTD